MYNNFKSVKSVPLLRVIVCTNCYRVIVFSRVIVFVWDFCLGLGLYLFVHKKTLVFEPLRYAHRS